MKCSYVLLAAILAHPFASYAQTVQKCQSRDGVRFHSAPCGHGERTVEVWDATPVPEVPTIREVSTNRYASSRARREPRLRNIGRSHYRSRRNAFATLSDAAPYARSCEAARAYRDAMERRAGLNRNYDLLSALQRPVFEACR